MDIVLVQESISHWVIFGGRVLKSKKVGTLAFKKSSEKNSSTRRKNRSSPRNMFFIKD
jgi:hypothetical protein